MFTMCRDKDGSRVVMTVLCLPGIKSEAGVSLSLEWSPCCGLVVLSLSSSSSP